MMAPKFIIQDWAGNTCFHGKTFPSFEDAWSFLYETFDYLEEEEFNEQMDEFYVEEKGLGRENATLTLKIPAQWGVCNA